MEAGFVVILQVAIFLAGLAVLSWSADKFVYGASALARNIGISPMMIGLTIVAKHDYVSMRKIHFQKRKIFWHPGEKHSL